VTDNCLYLLYLYYVFVFAYELYDLKNCWDIRMMSGVLHHVVLLIIIPMNWVRLCNREKALMFSILHSSVLTFSPLISPPPWSPSSQPITLIAVPSVWMTVCTYFTNIPAHIRSFMVHLGKCVSICIACAFQRRRP